MSLSDSALTARSVDPRSIPTRATRVEYYVIFWSRELSDEFFNGVGVGWSSDEFLVTGASSLAELQRWIENNADGRACEVFVSLDGKVSTRLLGHDPTDPEEDP